MTWMDIKFSMHRKLLNANMRERERDRERGVNYNYKHTIKYRVNYITSVKVWRNVINPLLFL